MKYVLLVVAILMASTSFAQSVDSKFVAEDPKHDFLYSKISGGTGSRVEKIYEDLATEEADVVETSGFSDFDFDYTKAKSSKGLYCTKAQKSAFVLTWRNGLILKSTLSYQCVVRVSFDKTGAHLN